MLKRTCILEMVFLLVLAFLFAWGTTLENTQQALSDGMIRLHVVGASDEVYDQRVKLQVRDAVLLAAEPILAEAENKTEAKSVLAENLSVLTEAANACLSELSPGTTAAVTLRRELFGTRYYEDFSLPGGYYDALRVTIGSGAGKNWWCVVYPQICTGAYAGDEMVPAMGMLTEEAQGMIYGQTPEYRLKFKTLEVFENILLWFRTRGEGIPASS